MSDLLPIFPLPNVVLFPNVFLPLHIFEPRYREMVADAVASDRMIGMVLLRPGWQGDYEGRPPVFPVGCSGVITHVDKLEDGQIWGCVKCGAALHACVQCAHFDTIARFQCRKPIPKAILAKSAKNDCPEFAPQIALDLRGRNAVDTPDQARSAFDKLFK